MDQSLSIASFMGAIAVSDCQCGSGVHGGDGQGGGRRDENDSSEIVIGRVGEELGRRSKTSKDTT